MTGERLFGPRGQSDDMTADLPGGSTPVPVDPVTADPVTPDDVRPDVDAESLESEGGVAAMPPPGEGDAADAAAAAAAGADADADADADDDRMVVSIMPASMAQDDELDPQRSVVTARGSEAGGDVTLTRSLWAAQGDAAQDTAGAELSRAASNGTTPPDAMVTDVVSTDAVVTDALSPVPAAAASAPRSAPSGAVVAMADDTVATEIRRWDDSDTDVMHAVGRHPEPLSERAAVDVQVTVQEPRSRGSWYEIPVMLLVAFTLAFLLRTFVVQVFYVPSGSMIPTLEINDRIATEKVTYLFRDLERGDVIVFAGDEPFGSNADMSTAQQVATGVGQFLGVVPVDAEDFVKRVIGLEGDTIEIVDGVVSVNGVVLDEPYAYLDASNGTWEVPAGSLFVMGDNRPNSGDSRTALGFIDRGEVVGRAVAKIWPLDRVGSVEGVDWDPIPAPG